MRRKEGLGRECNVNSRTRKAKKIATNRGGLKIRASKSEGGNEEG